MKVILLQDVPNVGKKYEVKNVSDGYGRNFLLPRNLAKIATTQAMQEIEKLKKQSEQEKQIQQDILEKNIKALDGLKITIKEKANEKGHLFAAIHQKEISKILKAQEHLDIPAEMIEWEKPIKEIGEYKINVRDKEFLLVVSSQ
jgi:large subunit ribosomal protein L9